MAAPKVVFLGSRALGRFALEFLRRQKDIELIGKVVLDDYSGNYWKEDPSDLHWPPTIEYKSLEETNFDLGISVNYWDVVRPPILERPRLGFFNIHHSYNLMYRGVNINTFAILEARKHNRWYHGTTLHKMAPKVDTGDIVASRDVSVTEHDTARSLFEKVEAVSREIVVDWFPRLWQGEVLLTPPSPVFMNFRRKDMVSREINPMASPLEIFDLVRALTFPPFERPFVSVNGEKTYLTTLRNEGSIVFTDAGDDRIVFVKSH